MYLLRKPSVLLLVVTALLTSGAATNAQQDGDVKVIITAKSQPATLPTLLVMCDLVCNWKLDGEIKGQIDAGGSTKVKVEPGQHMVEGTTDDGVDQVKLPSIVKPTGQTMVSIELQPIRYARLIAEQEERDEAAKEQAAQERAERDLAERQNRERQERERIAHDEAIGVWTDSKTGLMWTKKDNGDGNVTTEKQAKQYDLTWQKAVDYCWNLRIGGYSDWRLSTIDELKSIFSADSHIQGECCGKTHEAKGYWHVKGNLLLTGTEWSKTEGDPFDKTPWNEARTARFFDEAFQGDKYIDTNVTWSKKDSFGMRALCVRSSEN
jgi:hypothetical protein